jgi:predicted ATPase
VLVGREAEGAVLAWGRGGARAGRPVAVMVSGEAGVGKSRLMREFTARAGAEGARVWTGRCLPLADGLAPYGPWVEMLREIASDVGPARLRELAEQSADRLAVLVSDLAGDASGGAGDTASGPLAADAAHPRLHADLLDFVERLAREPTVLVVEDLHWADRSTRAVLSTLVAGLRRGHLLLVCTYRIGEVPPDHPTRALLMELTRSGLDRIDLGPLGEGETARLMAGITRTEPAAVLAREVFARSGGNPFLVEELVAAGPEAGTLPDQLREILLLRVRRLPALARAAMRVIALAGRGVDHGLLDAVLSPPVDRLPAELRRAVEDHLLVVDGERYAFRHALVAEALVADTIPGERIALHRALAEALAARAADQPPARPSSIIASEQAELAHHWAAAGEAGPALVAAVTAGLAAERASAMPEARRNLEHALELWWRAPSARAQSGLDLVELYRRAAEAASTVGGGRVPFCVVSRGAVLHPPPPPPPRRCGRRTRGAGPFARAPGSVRDDRYRG